MTCDVCGNIKAADGSCPTCRFYLKTIAVVMGGYWWTILTFTAPWLTAVGLFLLVLILAL